MYRTGLCLLGVCAASLATVALGNAPLGTAITYQGRLMQSGLPVNGTHSFVFSLWDGPVGGAQVGTSVVLPSVAVSDGTFTVPLDFGTSPYAVPAARWLQVTVDGTELLPRQELTAAPYSLATRGITVSAAGFVGIGTANPQRLLDVAGTARFANDQVRLDTRPDSTVDIIQIPDNGKRGLSIQMGNTNMSVIETYQWNGQHYVWRFAVSKEGNGVFAGNIGIGTDSPTHKVHIVGVPGVDGIRFPDGTVQTSAAVSGGGPGGVGGVREFVASGSFVVPAGVSRVMVEMWGGGGGGHASGNGGGTGAYVQCVLPVTAGETLECVVGSGGVSGQPSQDGGNTLVRRAGTVLAQAGGGKRGTAAAPGTGGVAAAGNGIVRNGFDGFDDDYWTPSPFNGRSDTDEDGWGSGAGGDSDFDGMPGYMRFQW